MSLNAVVMLDSEVVAAAAPRVAAMLTRRSCEALSAGERRRRAGDKTYLKGGR